MIDLIVSLQTHFFLFILLLSILGLAVGSFLNVVIYRVPIILEESWQEQSREILNLPASKSSDYVKTLFNICWPRSHCPSCKKTLKFYHNIPIFSYLLLNGQCAYCRTQISLRYPFVEFLTFVATLWVGLHFGVTWETVAVCLFTWILIPLIFIDLDYQILPDVMTLPLLWLGLIVNLWNLFTPYSHSLVGAVIGYLSLWIVSFTYKLLTGRTGMGNGDFKLLAAIGAWTGWELLPFTLVLASAAGSVIGIILILTKKQQRHSAIPFGPFLAIAGWIALLYGKPLMQAYIQLFA